jgi:hypothetical protein
MSDTTDHRGAIDSRDSPITKKLLNLPGQSVDTKLQDFAVVELPRFGGQFLVFSL